MKYRILVPLDGSVAAEAALAEADRLAGDEAEVYFLHVIPPLPLSVGAPLLGMQEGRDEQWLSVGGISLTQGTPPLPAPDDFPAASAEIPYDRALEYLEGLRQRIRDSGGLNIVRTGDPVD